ncbi:hypothetical protein ACFSE1_11000 [Rhizobium helianthi]|uniref:Lipopolysaccharide biosynthesis protein n=1 Tax=Rhizobium helianthi TaxID=1132695 RepID=A0ABW4M3F5_9HYPH
MFAFDVVRDSMHFSGRRFSGKAMLTSLLLAGFASLGALAPVALPLNVERQFTATASLNVVLPGQADLVDALPSQIYQPQVLDRIAERLGWSGQDIRSRQGVFDFLNDIITGDAMTIDRSEASLRERLQGMLKPVVAPDGRTILLLAQSSKAEEAVNVANAGADVLKQLLEQSQPSAGQERLAKLRTELEQAQSSMEELDLSPEELANVQQQRNQRSVLAAQADALARQQEMLERRADALSLWKAADYSGRELPDELQVTGLEAQRQRYLDAEVRVQQLSVSLGPRHPTLMAAEGAAADARAAIAKAVTALIAQTNRERAEVKAQQEKTAGELAALDANPVPEKVQAYERLEQKAETLRKTYLEALRADSRDVEPAAVIVPLRPAAVSDVSVSGLPLWIYSLLGAFAGLCLGGACLPARPEAEAETEAEVQTLADPFGDAFEIEPQILPDYLPTVEASTSHKALEQPVDELLEPSVPMRIAVSPTEEDLVEAQWPSHSVHVPEWSDHEEPVDDDEMHRSVAAMLEAVANDDRSHEWLRELIMANVEPLGEENPLPPLMEAALFDRSEEQVVSADQEDELLLDVAELQVLLEQLQRMREVLSMEAESGQFEPLSSTAGPPQWRNVA